MFLNYFVILYFREEMEDVVGSVFDLVGRTSDPILEEEVINERVNRIFQVSNQLTVVEVYQFTVREKNPSMLHRCYLSRSFSDHFQASCFIDNA